MFNAEAFKQSVVTEANADKYSPLPVGEYSGQIVEAKIGDAGEGKFGPWARYDVTVEVTDPRSERPHKVRGGIMLNLTESGSVASGQNENVKFGQFRTAVGLNVPGKPFQWSDPVGKSVKILVSHRADTNDAEKIYEDVKAWKAPY